MSARQKKFRYKNAVEPGLSEALLFMLATALLLIMSFALQPVLVLPLIAFAAMAAATRFLAMRLYRDFTNLEAPTR